MHKLADELQASVAIPLLHIADATGSAVLAARCSRPALLATRFTMEQPFYTGRLTDRFGLASLVPDAPGRAEIHRIIYDELCRGIVTDRSRRAVLAELDRLRAQGADSLILGCTELTMLLGPEHVDLPLFDTTRLHAAAAVDFALDGPAH
jgi:aspartate racemase